MKSLLDLSWILILSLLPVWSLCQQNWVSYSHAIQTEGYEGLRFRLQASVRAEIVEDSASARLWARVDKEGRRGFFDNMWETPIRNSEWETYTIEGTIDAGGYQIAFGALCQYNGRFFFDDISLDIETEKDQWKNVFSADFEGHHSDFVQGVQRGESGFNENYDAEIHKTAAASGNQCLLIIGKGVPNFGLNNAVGRFAEVNGIRLYYEVYGDGQPLVVLHGNGGSIEDAATHYPYFIENNYKVIMVDSRAQGKSTDTELELTYEIMAADINELLNQLNLDSVYLWGHSDGAIIGLVMALKYPGKVKKLVAFAPNIQADSSAIEPPVYRWIEKLAQNLLDQKQRKLINLIWKHPNIPLAELRTIQSEVLLMSGDRDMVTLDHTLQIFKYIPKVQLCIIPGSTHGAAWEKKALFLEIIGDFFAKPFSMPNSVDFFTYE